MNANQLMQQALAAHQQNRLGEAERLYRAILAQQPLNHVALHNLGLIASATGHLGPAIDLIGQAIQLDPGNPNYRTNSIGVLDAAGRWPEAQAAANQLIALCPNDVSLRINVARMLLKHGKPAPAAEHWRIAIGRTPADPQLRFEYAQTLELAGDLQSAEDEYRRALEQRPEYLDALVNLAGIFLKTDRNDEGIALLQKAASLSPTNAEVLSTLGGALISRGRVSEGSATLQRAYQIAPQQLDVLRNLGYAELVRGNLDAAMRINRQVCDLLPSNLHVYAALLLTSLYVEATPEEELKLHQGYGARASADVKPRPPQPRQRVAGERLRIGYVSPDFRTHPVGHFIEPVLAHHDRSRFEIHCFSTAATVDDLTQRIQASVDVFHAAHQLTFEQLDRLIRDQQIDILIDLAGHTGGSGLFVFAAKPAPLQVSYLGYPHTTGLSTIDLRITDAIADPPGASDAAHVETLARLPHSFGLFHAPPGAPDVRASPVRENGFITFGTVSRLEKWSDLVLTNWSAVLNAVDGSKFRVIGLGYDDEQFRQEVLARLERFGIDRSRVDLIGRKPFLGYLDELSKIDIVLDTFPFNGHTTTLQGLYMGVPTVTLAGQAHRSRMGASVLTALGLPHLIAHSSDEFRNIAIGLAKNREELDALRSGLRAQLLASSLGDAPAFVRAYESLLLEAWTRTLAQP